MQEKTILKISIIIIIIGIGFLFLYVEELDLKPIENIESYKKDETVYLIGEVKSVRVSDKAIFLKIEGKKIEDIEIIVFNDEKILLEEGNFVEIYGTIEEYKGKKEVIANKVILKS